MPQLAINTNPNKKAKDVGKLQASHLRNGIPVETEAERQHRIYSQVGGAQEAMDIQQPHAGPSHTVAQTKSQQQNKVKPRKQSRKQLQRKKKATERGEAYSDMQRNFDVDKNKLQATQSAPRVNQNVDSGQNTVSTSMVGHVARTDKKKKRQNRKQKAY